MCYCNQPGCTNNTCNGRDIRCETQVDIYYNGTAFKLHHLCVDARFLTCVSHQDHDFYRSKSVSVLAALSHVSVAISELATPRCVSVIFVSSFWYPQRHVSMYVSCPLFVSVSFISSSQLCVWICCESVSVISHARQLPWCLWLPLHLQLMNASPPQWVGKCPPTTLQSSFRNSSSFDFLSWLQADTNVLSRAL